MMRWLKRTFGGDQPKTVGDVMSAYGELVEKYPLAILDTSMLPIPKAKMKIVLKALYAKASNLEQKNLFETGFVFLSKFQEGVGATPISGELMHGDTAANLSANMATLDKWMPLEKKSITEMEILLAEWKRFKEGEPI
jgi:hypothetical protein